MSGLGWVRVGVYGVCHGKGREDLEGGKVSSTQELEAETVVWMGTDKKDGIG